MLTIGVTCRSVAADAAGRGGSRKPRWAVEQTLADALARCGVLVAALPAPPGDVDVGAFAGAWMRRLDGLLLQGGDSISAASAEQCTSRRDRFELALLSEAMTRGVPVLGVCRGLQLINLSLGGTLRRCPVDPVSGLGVHSDPLRYELHGHAVDIDRQGRLARVYSVRQGEVTSMHDFAIDQLATLLQVEAWCSSDHSIEAASVRGSGFVVGVQWHPEFHGAAMLPAQPLWAEFMHRVAAA